MRPMKPRAPGSATDTVVKLVNQIGVLVEGDGVKAVADFENLHPGTVRKWMDPLENSDVSYSRVARLTQHFGATAAAEHLASLAGGTFVPEVAADDARFSELTGAALDHLAQATREIIEAHSQKSDGGAAFTSREALHVLDPLLSLSRDVANLIALARAIAGEASQ